MSSPFDDQIAAAAAGFAQQRDALVAARTALETEAIVATSSDGLLTVTMSLAGRISDLTFASAGYTQLQPGQLSALLLQTIEAARDRAGAQAETRTQEILGSDGVGAGLRDTMAGGDEFGNLLAGLEDLWSPREDGR